jgi:hypothetical protein
MTPATPQPPVRQLRGLHVTLWIVQILLALTFGFPGSMKVSQPIGALAPSFPWVSAVPP